MQLDGCHSRVRNILRVNGFVIWRDFKDVTTDKLLKAEYEDDSGTIFRFDRFDRQKLVFIQISYFEIK